MKEEDVKYRTIQRIGSVPLTVAAKRITDTFAELIADEQRVAWALMRGPVAVCHHAADDIVQLILIQHLTEYFAFVHFFSHDLFSCSVVFTSLYTFYSGQFHENGHSIFRGTLLPAFSWLYFSLNVYDSGQRMTENMSAFILFLCFALPVITMQNTASFLIPWISGFCLTRADSSFSACSMPDSHTAAAFLQPGLAASDGLPERGLPESNTVYLFEIRSVFCHNSNVGPPPALYPGVRFSLV